MFWLTFLPGRVGDDLDARLEDRSSVSANVLRRAPGRFLKWR